jgi:NADH-quinone oxidoreductase subunit N
MVTLAVIAVVFSLIGSYYYLRVVKVMYFDDPSPAAAATPIVATTEMRVALSLNGALVLVLGIVPQYLLKLCADAMVRTLGG